MRYVEMGRSGVKVSVIGQGTWKMGDDQSRRSQEIDALRTGIAAGLNLIDTAEMYANGGAESVVAEAIADCREEVFVVTKVWATNASYDDTLRAAQNSLKHLKTSHIDLYLLHWPSVKAPVEETMRAMRTLVDDGLIRTVGVSNFSVELMQRAQEALGDIPLTGNQVPLHLQRRVVEKEVLPFCQRNAVTVMAYSPLGQGNFPEPGTPERSLLDEIGTAHGASAHQIALSWVASRPGVVAIPKASNPKHVQENAAAGAIELSPDEVRRIEACFPLPSGEYEVKWLG